MRTCFSCGSTKTHIDRRTGWHQWYSKDWFVHLWFCSKCYMKYFTNPKWSPIWNPKTHKKWDKILNPRRMYFKDRTVYLKTNPRTGYCSRCPNNIFNGSCIKTHIHHIKYHNEDPLKDTVELCASCHSAITYQTTLFLQEE